MCQVVQMCTATLVAADSESKEIEAQPVIQKNGYGESSHTHAHIDTETHTHTRPHRHTQAYFTYDDRDRCVLIGATASLRLQIVMFRCNGF